MTICSHSLERLEISECYWLINPWVRWIKVEFHDDVGLSRCHSVRVGSALVHAFNFEWASQVSSNVENLSVEKHEIIRIALVWDDNGVDSLFFDFTQSEWVVERVGSIEGVDIVLTAGEGVVAVLVDRSIGIFRLEVWPVLAVLWAGAGPLLHRRGVILADGEVVRSTADLNIGFKETHGDTVSRRDWKRKTISLSEVLAFDSNGASGILVLDPEGSIDKTSAHHLDVWSDINALFSDTKHLDHHLVVSDPWGDLKSVGHDEGVVVVKTDVTKGDGVWLLSASTHAEDLVAVWVVEEVLILSSVGHKEGVEVTGLERIVAPLIDALIAVHL